MSVRPRGCGGRHRPLPVESVAVHGDWSNCSAACWQEPVRLLQLPRSRLRSSRSTFGCYLAGFLVNLESTRVCATQGVSDGAVVARSRHRGTDVPAFVPLADGPGDRGRVELEHRCPQPGPPARDSRWSPPRVSWRVLPSTWYLTTTRIRLFASAVWRV